MDDLPDHLTTLEHISKPPRNLQTNKRVKEPHQQSFSSASFSAQSALYYKTASLALHSWSCVISHAFSIAIAEQKIYDATGGPKSAAKIYSSSTPQPSHGPLGATTATSPHHDSRKLASPGEQGETV